MKTARTIFVTAAIFMAIGFGIGRYWPSHTEDGVANSKSGKREILYWVAPMDSNYRRDGPGKSPMGMDLIPVYAEERGAEGAGVVSIDPTVVSNLGVRTASAERGVLSRRIETVGYVDYDEETLHQISTRVDGWIERLAVKANGDPITEGQLLFELYSPALVNAQEEYLATLDSSTKGLAEASRKRLAALGMSSSDVENLARERSVRQRVPIFSQRDGYVAHLGVREGAYVTPATKVMSVAELDRVWVLAEVFERQASWVQTGQRADIALDYLRDDRLQGLVDYVYPELDQKTRTLKVRLRLDNTDRALRPNMFARVTIYGSETEPVVHVPREAVIRGGSVDRVVVSLGEGRFHSRPVRTGVEAGNRVAVNQGLREGERVVISGQFLIDSESNIDAALTRLSNSEAGREETDRESIEHDQMDHGVMDQRDADAQEEPRG